MLFRSRQPSRLRAVLLPTLGGSIAAYGLFAFFRRDLPTYMLVRTHFVFFDFSEPIPMFYLDYLAMMGTCIFLVYYAARFLRKRAGESGRSADQNSVIFF